MGKVAGSVHFDPGVAVGEEWWPGGPKRCCEDDLGGSHYHCARCNKPSSMMGHYMLLKDGTYGFSCEQEDDND